MDRGAQQATVHGIVIVGYNLVTKPSPTPPTPHWTQATLMARW